MNAGSNRNRTMGLLGATGVGVGAIVGGGILALAGVAFASAGPGAILAFGLNGFIAFLTALSFAEMSSAFPESGGTYTFAKKVLSVRTAFGVGWVVWFASIGASILYAMGFASFGILMLEHLCEAVLGPAPAWLTGRRTLTFLAVGATTFYTFTLVQKSRGGGQWATAGKVLVFAVLIVGGFWVLLGRPSSTWWFAFKPFFPKGARGLFQAMGYTFIALQGFDLIAAVAGEVRNPGRAIPRAMFLSLAGALAIYLPFLFIISTVGVGPGQSIMAESVKQPETIVALCVQNYLGPLGYWLVLCAAVLSMLSALHANLFAASRIAFAMGRDRTFPDLFANVHEHRGTPVSAVFVSGLSVVTILLVIPDIASAGAVSSLIFLLSFALAHLTNILTRTRGGAKLAPFQVPLFPLVPIAGTLCCLSLALFQGITVPSAGLIAAAWLGLGAFPMALR